MGMFCGNVPSMSTPQQPYRLNIKRGKKFTDPSEASSFLQQNDHLSPLLPTIKRHLSLQKECRKILPSLFDGCEVLNLVENQLVLSTPNAALASKLKQQLPKLQFHLQQQGWQINAIKIKVQVTRTIEKVKPVKQAVFTNQAIAAFHNLQNHLEPSEQNAQLLSAIERLTKKHLAKD